MIIIFFILIFIISAYAYLLFRTQDFKAKGTDISIFKNSTHATDVLFVYPHPDDETMVSGGLINKLSSNINFNVHAITLTRGEKGKELLNISDAELAKVRAMEFTDAVRTLGVKNYSVWEFPDGEVDNNTTEVRAQLTNYIIQNNIQTIVTFERTGIYGHKDHVTLTKIVKDIHDENKGLKVFYSTIPEKYERILNFPKHIKNLELTKTTVCQAPEFRINISSNVNKKYKAAKTYKSQKLAHGFPLWAGLFLLPFEYYTTIYEDPISKF